MKTTINIDLVFAVNVLIYQGLDDINISNFIVTMCNEKLELKPISQEVINTCLEIIEGLAKECKPFEVDVRKAKSIRDYLIANTL